MIQQIFKEIFYYFIMSSTLQPSIWDDAKSWDSEWASDWKYMEEIFDKIDELKNAMKKIDMPFLYRHSQQSVILNLEKFAFSLSKLIEHKYS